MQVAERPGDDGDPGTSPGWRGVLLILGLYAACVAIATYPRIVSLRTTLPSRGDPAQHLTIMRWYRTCLLEGRLPLHCHEIQYPCGAPLGNFTPLHLQALLYLPLSVAISNDILCYNVLWWFAFLLAGVGTFALAWHVLRDRTCAGFAGLLAMLGGPMMLHARGHLELMYFGLFPLFLVAWMRFLERPGRRRLAAAALLYLLTVMGAAYFAVLAVVPALLYVGYGAARAGRGGWAAWLRGRAAWITGFVALVVPGLLLLFAGQLLGLARGGAMDRPLSEFLLYGAPAWSYVAPTKFHGLSRLLAFDAYDAAGYPVVECASYPGLVALALILYAAVRRAGLRDAGYWWSAFLILVVLSFGAQLRVGRYRADLPGLWLWKHVFAFRLIRAPARFNLLAVVFGAVLASAGLRRLLDRFHSRGGRAALLGTLAVLAVADLATVPFATDTLPATPACYDVLRRRDPGMTLLEVPLHVSGNAHDLNSLCGYWQSFHRGRTSGGYSSLVNASFDHRLVHNSPFSASSMAESAYLREPEAADFGVVKGVAFRDYAWLYLHVHDLRYVVLHQWPGAVPVGTAGAGRLKAQLALARIFEDGETAVYARDLLEPPARPVLLCTTGWRGGWHGREQLILSRNGGVAVYNPSPGSSLTFALEAVAFREARTVRLRAGDAVLARWVIRPSESRRHESPAFRLPAGLHHLAIESDGEARPAHSYEAATEGDMRPYSLIVRGISLRSAAPEAAPPAIARQGGDAPRRRLRSERRRPAGTVDDINIIIDSR